MCSVLRRASATVLAVGFVTLAGWTPFAAAADEVTTLDDARLRSVAALTSDPAHQRYWAASGGSGRLLIRALDPQGKALGGAATLDRTQDVQSLAVHGSSVFVGDTGGPRKTVTIWKMDGPVPTTRTLAAAALQLTYPDGRHASEAMFLTSDGTIHVVTSGNNPGIYVPSESPSTEHPVELKRVGDAPADVTDATMLAGGQVALRSATTVYFVDPTTWAVTKETPITGVKKGAGLAESLSGGALLASGADKSITMVPMDDVAGATVTPMAVATPSSRPVTTAAAPMAPGPAIALVGAAVGAIVMALITVIKR